MQMFSGELLPKTFFLDSSLLVVKKGRIRYYIRWITRSIFTD